MNQGGTTLQLIGVEDVDHLGDILLRLGYQADGLYIGLGIEEGIGYSTESHRLAEKFASEHSAPS